MVEGWATYMTSLVARSLSQNTPCDLHKYLLQGKIGNANSSEGHTDYFGLLSDTRILPSQVYIESCPRAFKKQILLRDIQLLQKCDRVDYPRVSFCDESCQFEEKTSGRKKKKSKTPFGRGKGYFHFSFIAMHLGSETLILRMVCWILP